MLRCKLSDDSAYSLDELELLVEIHHCLTVRQDETVQVDQRLILAAFAHHRLFQL